MTKDDCMYPDCLIPTDFGRACEHSCPFEADAKMGEAKRQKRQRPGWRNCNATAVIVKANAKLKV